LPVHIESGRLNGGSKAVVVVENPQSSNKTTNNYLKGRRETRVGVGKRGKGVMDVQKEACTQGTAV
jgi:hypothetical protein